MKSFDFPTEPKIKSLKEIQGEKLLDLYRASVTPKQAREYEIWYVQRGEEIKLEKKRYQERQVRLSKMKLLRGGLSL